MIGRVLGVLGKAVFRNLQWKLLSLAIAVLIWVLVANEPELSTYSPVRVEYRNQPDQIELAAEPISTIMLELRGPSGELRAMDQGATIRPGVVLDMTSVGPGVRTFPIGSDNVRLPRGVSLVRAVPSEVRLTLERRAERSVPVETQFMHQGAGGYEVTAYRVTPPQMLIAGPGSHVGAVRAVATDPIDLSGVVGTAEFRVNVFVNDAFVRFVSKPQVAVTVNVKKKK